jgi:cytochrome c-type biogenesis protein
MVEGGRPEAWGAAAPAATKDRPSPGGANSSASARLELRVGGMTCASCAAALEHGLSELEYVSAVEVDIERERVVVAGTSTVPEAEVRDRIRKLGYDVQRDSHDEKSSERGQIRALVWLGVAVVGVLIVSLLVTAAFGSYATGASLNRLKASFAEVSAVAFGLSFLFGVVVGFAPSTYAVLPAIMGYAVRSHAHGSRRAVAVAVPFVGGMVFADMLVGAAFGALGGVAVGFFSTRLPLWYAIATLALVGLALVNLKLWRPRLPRFVPRPATGAGAAFALGIPFGLLTCPACTPLLLPVALGAAVTGKAWYGALLVGAFAVGRGIPLVALSASTGVLERIRAATASRMWMERATALLCFGAAAYFIKQFFVMGGFGAL